MTQHNTKQLYKLLNVTENATVNEINKSYKKLAKIYHPDKNKGSDDMFKKLIHARDILTNEKRRELYDKYGDGKLKEMNEEVQKQDILEKQKDIMKSQNHIKYIPLCFSLEEYYTGISIIKTIERQKICRQCNGYGKLEIELVICHICNGQGIQFRQGVFALLSGGIRGCQYCDGNGKYVNTQKTYNPCKQCNETGQISEPYDIKIDIPKGIGAKNNVNWKDHEIEEINVKISDDDGDEYEIDKFGSVIVTLQREKTDNLEWIEDDLALSFNISLQESLCGFKREFKHPSGKSFLFYTNATHVIKPFFTKIMNGLGMPKLSKKTKYGNLILIFNIDFPEIVDEKYFKNLTNTFITNKKLVNEKKLDDDKLTPIEKFKKKITKEEIEKNKLDILCSLKDLQTYGVLLSKEYTLDSNYEEMRHEYELHKKIHYENDKKHLINIMEIDDNAGNEENEDSDEDTGETRNKSCHMQ